jgi:nucleoside phosphorylase
MEPLDIAIVFALREEFLQFYPTIAHSSQEDPSPTTGRSFFLFDLAATATRMYKCVTAFVGSMGAQDALSLTQTMIDRYSPKNIVLIGIAGSLSSDVLVGDVIIATEVEDYLQDSKIDEFRLAPGTRNYKSHIRLLNLIDNFQFANKGISDEITLQSTIDLQSTLKNLDVNAISAAPIRMQALPPQMGPIASGPIVATWDVFAKWLRSHNRKFLAVEMEAAGVANAIYQNAGDQRMLVIRGISDMADDRKEALDRLGGGAFRKLAMRNALRVFEGLVRAQAFEDATRNDGPDGRHFRECYVLAYGPGPGAYGDIQALFRDKVYDICDLRDRAVRVFGFTYVVFWNLMKNILADPHLSDWVFDLSYISPDFVKANPSVFGDYWLTHGNNTQDEMRTWFRKNENVASLVERRISVRLRSFDLIPFLHGKLFADGTLFLHSAQWDEAGSLSYPNTFHEIVPQTAISARANAYRALFNSWIQKYDKSEHETIFASQDFDWDKFQQETRA